MYYNNVLDLIGDTPLMCLKETTGLNIFAKAEFLQCLCIYQYCGNLDFLFV